MEERGWQKSKTLGEAARHALTGIGHALRHERNFRIQLLIYIVGVAAALIVGMPLSALALVVLSATLILVLEMANTALEVIADAISPQYHEGLRRAEDIAAGGGVVPPLGGAGGHLFLVFSPLF